MRQMMVAAEGIIDARGELRYIAGATRPKLDVMLRASSLRDDGLAALPAPFAATSQSTTRVPASVQAALLAKNPERAKPLPFDVLHTLDGSLDLQVQQLYAQNLEVQDVELMAHLTHGVLKVETLTARTLGGVLSATAQLDANLNPPTLGGNIVVTDMRIGDQLARQLGKRVFDGEVDLDMKLRASGETEHALLKTLESDGTLNISNGAIYGIDLDALRTITPGSWQTRLFGEDARTAFTSLSLSWNGTNGVIYTQDAQLVTNVGRVEAAGNVNVGSQLVDMRVQPVAGRGEGGIRLPAVLVQGPVSAPNITPDLASIVEQVNDRLGKKLQQQLPNSINDALGEGGVGELLKDFAPAQEQVIEDLFHGILGR